MKQKQKTLIILTPGFPASEEDSSCLPFQQTLTRSINLQFPDIRIVVVSLHYPFHNKTYSCAGAIVYPLGGRNRRHFFSWMLRRKAKQKLEILYHELEIIGLLSFWYGECAAIANSFSEKYSLKHYCWLLGQDARPGNKYPGIVKLQSDQLVALSDFLKFEFFRNYSVLPSGVICPGVELKKYATVAGERDIDILGVGSLIPLKGFDIFLDMVAGIKPLFPNMRCIIIGKGPQHEQLQDKIIKLGLSTNVFMLGELEHQKVIECMMRTKILLHPSSYEGFSGVCMEALSSGANVISFTRAMNYEIQQWHIVAGKPEMLNKLTRLLHQAENKIIPDFPIEQTAWQIMELFGEKPKNVSRSLEFSLQV